MIALLTLFPNPPVLRPFPTRSLPFHDTENEHENKRRKEIEIKMNMQTKYRDRER